MARLSGALGSRSRPLGKGTHGCLKMGPCSTAKKMGKETDSGRKRRQKEKGEVEGETH